MNAARAKPPSPGFILATTLWALVALALIAAYMDRATDTRVENVRQAKLMLQAELDRRSTEETVLYLLATNRMNHRGVLLMREQIFTDPDEPLPDGFGDGELRVGGELYAGLGGVLFTVQDEAGLVPVNFPDDPTFHLLLEHLGVPADVVARLVPKLGDYIDLNQDLALDGAERVDYVRAGLPPPANWFLANPMELKRVLGADSLLAPGQWRRLRAMATPHLVWGTNFNTMPVELAAVLLGVAPKDLGAFLEARAEKPIGSLDHLGELTGQYPPLDPDAIIAYPTSLLRLSSWWPGGGPRTVVGVTLTPGSEIVPWRKEYRYAEHAEFAEAVLAKRPTPRQVETELLTTALERTPEQDDTASELDSNDASLPSTFLPRSNLPRSDLPRSRTPNGRAQRT